MKHALKITLTALVGLTLAYSGCKKADVTPADTENTQQISQAEVAKNVAFNFYNSLASRFGSGLTTASKGLTTMDDKKPAQCGDVITTPTEDSFTRNDTSFTLKGNSIFTFTCSEGNEKSPYGPDGYTLVDYLNKTESGKKFINIFENSLNYVVSNVPGFPGYNIKGDASASARFATTGPKGITEYHDFSTKYKIQGLGGTADKDKPATFQGQVGFECKLADVYLSNGKKDTSVEYSGFMAVSKDTIESYFFVDGAKAYIKYEIDIKTGKILSGPTRIDY